MMRQIWFARVALTLSFIYAAVLVSLPQSIEFFRFALTEGNSFGQLVGFLAWPSVIASLCFVLSIYMTNSGTDSGAVFGRVLAVAVAVLPYLAVLAGAWWASERLLEAHQLRINLALALLVMACATGAIAYALFRPGQTQKIGSIFQGGYSAIVTPALAFLLFLSLACTPLFLDGPALVRFAQAIGPMGLMAIFFGLVSLMLSGIVLLTRGTRIPGIALLLLIAVGLGLTGRTNNHQVRVGDASARDKMNELRATSLEEWLDSRTDRADYAGEPYPIFLVAAQGGGIYAAYHAASVLTEVQAQWPEFSQHLFAVSSVSGGSLGSAFHVALTQAMKGTPDGKCGEKELKARDVADRFFSNDFLSPVLFMALFPDFAQRFWVQGVAEFDRALGLEFAFEEAWNNLSKELTLECNWPEANAFVNGNAFASWISELRWTEDGDLPILFLNTTHEESGRPIAVSTIKKMKHLMSIWDMGFKNDLRLSTAAVLSARFPYVTPFGWFEGKQLNWYAEPKQLQVNLGDGGYFDNSGTEVLTNLSLILKNLAVRRALNVDVYAIVIGDAGFAAENFIVSLRYLDDPLRTPPQVARVIRSMLHAFEVNEEPIGSKTLLSEVWAPISAVMGSREFRSKESVKTLLRINGVDAWHYDHKPETVPAYSVFNAYGLVFPLGSNTQDMPLGWLLSRYTRKRLALRVGMLDDCSGGDYASASFPVVRKLGDFMRTHSEDLAAAIDNYAANCSLKRLLALRK